MMYMGDYPITDPYLTYDKIAIKLVKKALKTPLLRDEIYCQLVKQTTKNPNSTSNARGWELLVLCSTIFRVHSDYESVLLKHLSTYNFVLDFDANSFITKSLRRLKVNGERKEPPTAEELKKTLEGSPIVFHVSLQSGAVKVSLVYYNR